MEQKKAGFKETGPSLFLKRRPSGFSYRLNRNKRFVFSSFFKDYCALGKGKQRVIFSHSDVCAGMVFGSSLTDDNVTGNYLLAAKYFDTQSFAFRFAAVLYFTFAFLNN